MYYDLGVLANYIGEDILVVPSHFTTILEVYLVMGCNICLRMIGGKKRSESLVSARRGVSPSTLLVIPNELNLGQTVAFKFLEKTRLALKNAHNFLAGLCPVPRQDSHLTQRNNQLSDFTVPAIFGAHWEHDCAARSTCAAAFSVRSSPLGADTKECT